jgi:poly(hydroxyalkanoate) granule-associated protein
MAKLKKSASKTTARTSAPKARRKSSSNTRKAARSSGLFNAKSITESAQQIWLAGMGAFTRAQAEGSKLFETLVREGLSLEQTARQLAGSRASAVRDAVETQVDQARERAADTWDKLEKVFEARVQRVLVKLGVPSRDDLNALTERVERLTEALRKTRSDKSDAAATPARAKTTRQAAPKKQPATKAATKATAKAASAARSPAKSSAVPPKRASKTPTLPTPPADPAPTQASETTA